MSDEDNYPDLDSFYRALESEVDSLRRYLKMTSYLTKEDESKYLNSIVNRLGYEPQLVFQNLKEAAKICNMSVYELDTHYLALQYCTYVFTKFTNEHFIALDLLNHGVEASQFLESEIANDFKALLSELQHDFIIRAVTVDEIKVKNLVEFFDTKVLTSDEKAVKDFLKKVDVYWTLQVIKGT